MTIHNFIKGWVGEAMGAAAHYLFLDKDVYTSLNNVTLQARGGTTQIDHVIISKYGIFVVEAKNIDGWIFGDEKSPQWSIVKVGRKYRIQNPLHQNFRHTKAISEFLNIDQDKIHPLVMFWGKCEFKTKMPPNVLRDGYTNYIKSFVQAQFSDKQVLEIIEVLKTGRLPNTWATSKQHLVSLKERYSSKITCPKCDEPLILRTVKSGERAGSSFYGCSAYPRCKFTKSQ